ncbi:MAG: amino acid permease, partial [Fimbriimonadaceae bacterium]|nr:amino acid permease [Alphaproteobacteria bacterium]
IMESVFIAAVFTLAEIFGLGLVIYTGLTSTPGLAGNLTQLLPPLELAPWMGVLSASLLAFFAFVGFEDIANVAEEVKNPRRTMPWAIFLTLSISTLIYVAVVGVIVLSVPMADLVTSTAPLALVFRNSDENIVNLFRTIAVAATLNGVLIQMIMASRILFGLAAKGNLPKAMAIIHPRTRTPVLATLLIVTIILLLALFLPIMNLGEITSQVVLVVFSLVNLSLIRLKLNSEIAVGDVFRVPILVPIVGLISCVGLLSSGFL